MTFRADTLTRLSALEGRDEALQALIAGLELRMQALEQPPADPPPPLRTLFGAFAGPDRFPNVDPVEAKAAMRTRVTGLLGGQLGVERIFNEQSWTVPAAGTPAIVSFTQDPAAVARGELDLQIVTFVQGLDPFTTSWLVLNHECDQTTRPYTPADQVAGARRFADVVRSVGKPNVKVATILMSWTLTRGADFWRQWYPGPDYVDALGWDAYWRPTAARTPETVYGPAYAVTQTEGKEFLIGETSLGAQGHGGHQLVDGIYQPIPDDEWTTFTSAAIGWLTGRAAAACWFFTSKTDGDWRLTEHPQALASWAAATTASVAA